MNTNMRTNAAYAALWSFATLVLIVLLQINLQHAYQPANDTIRISSARLITGPSEPDRISTLPTTWRPVDGSSRTRNYRIELNLDHVPYDPLYMYIPDTKQNLVVQIDGTTIHASAIRGNWQGPLSTTPALIRLPRDQLIIGKNAIDLYITTKTFLIGSLSEIHIGKEGDLLWRYKTLNFIQRTLKPALFGAQFFLAITSLAAFFYRPKDEIYGWLGGLLIYACLISAGVLADGSAQAIALIRPAIFLAPVGGITLLAFSLCFANWPRPPYLFRSMLGMSVIILGLVYFDIIPGRDMAFYFSIPLMLIITLAAVSIMTVAIVRHMNTEGLVFLSGLIFLIFGVFRDYLNIFGLAYDGPMMTQISRILVLTGISIFLIRRQTETATALDASADKLRQRLEQKEAELQVQHERERTFLRQQAVSEERQRLTSDLHDGVAGHLATIMALGESKDNKDKSVTQARIRDMTDSARNALVDLRLVLDALSVAEPDLHLALASFRERCVQPLENAGITIKWDMANLPDVEGLSRAQILNIVRILQEAMNNAVRHGEPEKIIISGNKSSPSMIQLSIENSGGHWKANSMPEGGHGMQNMRNRARQLEGIFEIEALPDGAKVILTFPLPD